MVNRIVSVPFSSMRSLINAAERPLSNIGSGREATESAVLPGSVPPSRLTAMPEQDLTVWSMGLLLESLISATRSLFGPTELRLVQIRKRDRA